MVSPGEVDKVVNLFPDKEEINFTAFAQMYNDATAKAGMPGLDEFREAFYAFDRNHDGQLELDELLAVCRALKVDS